MQEEHAILTNLGEIIQFWLKFTTMGVCETFLVFQVCRKNCIIYKQFVGG